MKKKKNIVHRAALKMSPYSKQILGWISVISALLYAISIWYGLDLSSIPAGILLVGLGSILILEEIFEGVRDLSFGDTVNISMGIFAIIIGILTAVQMPIPDFLQDIKGALYAVLALATVYAMYR